MPSKAKPETKRLRAWLVGLLVLTLLLPAVLWVSPLSSADPNYGSKGDLAPLRDGAEYIDMDTCSCNWKLYYHVIEEDIYGIPTDTYVELFDVEYTADGGETYEYVIYKEQIPWVIGNFGGNDKKMRPILDDGPTVDYSPADGFNIYAKYKIRDVANGGDMKVYYRFKDDGTHTVDIEIYSTRSAGTYKVPVRTDFDLHSWKSSVPNQDDDEFALPMWDEQWWAPLTEEYGSEVDWYTDNYLSYQARVVDVFSSRLVDIDPIDDDHEYDEQEGETVDIYVLNYNEGDANDVEEREEMPFNYIDPETILTVAEDVDDSTEDIVFWSVTTREVPFDQYGENPDYAKVNYTLRNFLGTPPILKDHAYTDASNDYWVFYYIFGETYGLRLNAVKFREDPQSTAQYVYNNLEITSVYGQIFPYYEEFPLGYSFLRHSNLKSFNKVVSGGGGADQTFITFEYVVIRSANMVWLRGEIWLGNGGVDDEDLRYHVWLDYEGTGTYRTWTYNDYKIDSPPDGEAYDRFSTRDGDFWDTKYNEGYWQESEINSSIEWDAAVTDVSTRKDSWIAFSLWDGANPGQDTIYIQNWESPHREKPIVYQDGELLYQGDNDNIVVQIESYPDEVEGSLQDNPEPDYDGTLRELEWKEQLKDYD